MNIVWIIFAIGSFLVTSKVTEDMEFKNTLDMALTYLVVWAIMFVLMFGTFALVIGI